MTHRGPCQPRPFCDSVNRKQVVLQQKVFHTWASCPCLRASMFYILFMKEKWKSRPRFGECHRHGPWLRAAAAAALVGNVPFSGARRAHLHTGQMSFRHLLGSPQPRCGREVSEGLSWEGQGSVKPASAARGESISQRAGMQARRLPEHLCAGHTLGHRETKATGGKGSFGWERWSWERRSRRNPAAS